jgi:hypothetical protein
LNQLSFPCGICVDQNKNISIADFDNHRVLRWECGANEGVIVAGGYGQGGGRNKLNNPINVMIDKPDSHRPHSLLGFSDGQRGISLCV